jgi:16S rRNA (adenine1518-N6/adenine1519-N6)-dimethyltransferase
VGRRLGQHFLSRGSILERIARAVCEQAVYDGAAGGETGDSGHAGPLVIEIGPGKGALTAPLLAHARKVIAIEVDPVLIHYLRHKFADPIDAGRLELVEGDVLKTDLAQWGPAAVAGNLPYYITSPILGRVFSMGANWERAVFLVQSEVAARMTASPGSRDYGYLSVLVQVHARAETLFGVPRTAFHPPPKVDSAVVRLLPRDGSAAWNLPDVASFLRFAGECFRHKRKTLRNNLAPVYGRERMDQIPEGKQRAEQLSVADLAALYRKLEAA